MNHRTHNPDGSPTLLLVFGFGNRHNGTDEQWLITHLTETDYRVEAITLPTNISDFETEYAGPLQRIHDQTNPDAILSHSLGGLVSAYLTTDAKQVYLAPWWGFYAGKVSRWERWLIPKLPITTPIIPIKTTRPEIGSHLPEPDWHTIPKRIAPVYITEIYAAQQRRPPIDDTATVYVSLQDTIISLKAIGIAVDSDQIRLYDGGHQLFSSHTRENAIESVLTHLP